MPFGLRRSLATYAICRKRCLFCRCNCRLSEHVAVQMRTYNPNIVTLSDPFRPTKLAEISSEIYDNEWTDACDRLEEEAIDEPERIRILLDVVMVTRILTFFSFDSSAKRVFEHIWTVQIQIYTICCSIESHWRTSGHCRPQIRLDGCAR